MKSINRLILVCAIVVLISTIVVITAGSYSVVKSSALPTMTTSVKFVSSNINADGIVTAQNQANLHFQTGGKLTYLPLKEGDSVYQGQTIASLDTYALQRQLSAALNIYRSTRDVFDQQVANSQNNYLQAQQTYPYNTFNAAGISGTAETNAINDIVKRIIDENQANLDNSVINVELANYALQLSRLTSPIKGIITHEDINVSGQNITPTTTFTVADPDTMVFRANVPMEYIYYITEGADVKLAIDGLADKIDGTVVKIYPAKVTLPTGQSVYQVDIQSDDLKKSAKLDMGGTAIITTNAKNVALVPAWTVLSGKYIWVEENGSPKLLSVTAGKVHGNQIEVTEGLSTNDKVIIDPEFISNMKYKLFTGGKTYVDKSLIQAPIITVSPTTAGKVQEIDVKEGQTVSAGDTLAVVGSETLRAQTDGLIISANDLTGSTVNQATQLIQMIRTVNMRVAGTIDENKGLSEIRVGQVVSFTVDALPGKTFWGYVDEISPSANQQVFSFSTSTERPTQQFTVYTKFDTSNYPDIKNGMSAKMVIYTKTK